MSRVRPMMKEEYEEKPRGRPFEPGDSRAGRPPGTTNKTTRILKEAVLMAAEAQGSDGAGKDGLVGYLQWAAAKHPKSFLSIVGKLLPLQVVGDPNKPLTIEHYESSDVMRQKLIERGIPLVLLGAQQTNLVPVKRPKVIEHEDVEEEVD